MLCFSQFDYLLPRTQSCTVYGTPLHSLPTAKDCLALKSHQASLYRGQAIILSLFCLLWCVWPPCRHRIHGRKQGLFLHWAHDEQGTGKPELPHPLVTPRQSWLFPGKPVLGSEYPRSASNKLCCEKILTETHEENYTEDPFWKEDRRKEERTRSKEGCEAQIPFCHRIRKS